MAAREGMAGGFAWILPKAEIENWMARARAGERLIYAHGAQLIRGETSLFVRELAMAGKVDPIQRRADPGGFDFTIQKRQGAVPSPRPSRSRGGDEADAAMDVVLRTLSRDANLGRRAHSNAELALIAGLETPAQAAWRMAKLAKAKMIRTVTVTTGPHAGWRIVTIIATGKSTLAPPSWERAKAEMRQEVVP